MASDSKRMTKKHNIIAAIQARMGSTRLPKKALRKIRGKTMIEIIYKRLSACAKIDRIVLTTSISKENDILAEHAKKIHLPCYRGSEEDLISRYLGTFETFGASAIVRITADCPLVDPALVDKMVSIYQKEGGTFDFFTNGSPPTFPDGLDIDILPLPLVKRLNKEVRTPLYREWLTVYICEHPKEFRIYNMTNKKDLSPVRLTVDYKEDLQLVRKIFAALGKNGRVFSLDQIMDYLDKRPQLLEINKKWVDAVIIRNIRSAAYHSLAPF